MGASQSSDTGVDVSASDVESTSTPDASPSRFERVEKASDFVSSHLYRYRTKIVRDLAWALTSPHVLGDPNAEGGVVEGRREDVGDGGVDAIDGSKKKPQSVHPNVFTDESASLLLKQSHPWLNQLDTNPSHITDWIKSQRGSNKLGFYFGALVEYSVRFNPAIGAEAVTVHRQVAKDLGAGRMVGQLKLVFLKGNEIVHWEYNVKYFVDAGSCVGVGMGTQSETTRTQSGDGVAEKYLRWSFPSRRKREISVLQEWNNHNHPPPPSGDSCYVGPFLHENLHIRCREAYRKLRLASHRKVSEWLDQWASDSLEGETLELTDFGKVKKTTETYYSYKHTSEQILRGFLFYPLGDKSDKWHNAQPRGTASDNHCRGWWVKTPEELMDVPEHTSKNISIDEKTKIRKWAVFTRKCHWLGPCEAIFRPQPSARDGADTQWIVKGVPELGIRDIEVFDSDEVIDAARKVLTLSDRGVLIAEMVGPFEVVYSGSNNSETVWRETSRGFVLPPDWNPWPTMRRTDPFRRRYERSLFTQLQQENSDQLPSVKDNDSFEYDERYGKFRVSKREVNSVTNTSTANEKTANETVETTAEIVFDEMYPDREDIEELGDDVRVGQRRVFKGQISWKTEKDFVRDFGSQCERVRRDASATVSTASVGASTFRDDGRPGLKPGAEVGELFLRAVEGIDDDALSSHDDSHSTRQNSAAQKLLGAISAAIKTEGTVVRPARPKLVRALAKLGKAADKQEENQKIDSFSGSKRRELETLAMRLLVTAAVRGTSLCLAALDNLSSYGAKENNGAAVNDGAPLKFSMSERRALSHALLDALGPAARRNGCFGDAFVKPVKFVFSKCLGDHSEWNANRNTSDPAHYHKSGLCPRVAVRFAKIVKVNSDAVLEKGAVSLFAEKLKNAIEAFSENSNDSRMTQESLGTRSDTPLNRAGAVAEMLVWSGESVTLSKETLITITDACVEAGHTSAAEALTKSSPFFEELQRRLASVHYQKGNHKAAKRIASEFLVNDASQNEEYDAFSFASDVFEAFEGSGDGDASAAFTAASDACTTEVSCAFSVGDNTLANVLLVNDLASIEEAKAWLECITETSAYATPIIGFDCEWRPGPGDVNSNPVTVAQFAVGSHTFFDEINDTTHARAVVLDCIAVFGPQARAALSKLAVEFVSWVFTHTIVCGFGVSGDAKRLVRSYPERFYDQLVIRDVTFVCVRDVAVTLGATDAQSNSLSRLTQATLGQNLDKEMQTSRWDLRPLTKPQILYSAIDALAPVLILIKLLRKSQSRVKNSTSDSGAPSNDVSRLTKPWARKEALERGVTERGALNSVQWRGEGDVRDALIALGALGGINSEDHDHDQNCLRIETWGVTHDGASSENTHNETLLCKTLAVVCEGEGGLLEKLALVVLPAGESSRVDFQKVETALGFRGLGLAGDTQNPHPFAQTVTTVRLASRKELLDLFGFPPGSVGPFGCRPAVVRPTDNEYKLVGQNTIDIVFDDTLVDVSHLTHEIAVGGGASGVKVVGDAGVMAKFANAKLASVSSD